jgi:hypothetical protein
MGIKALTAPLRWLARLLLALLILFEEWGWEPLRRAMVWLAGRLPLRPLERGLSRLPPQAALAVLVLPSLLIIPVKLLALWLITQGQALLGLAVIVAAKLGGTALLAWLFHLIQPALMQLPWFASFYARWTGWKAELLAWVRASAAWRMARALKLRLRRARRGA